MNIREISEYTEYHNKKIENPDYWDMLSVEQFPDTIAIELAHMLPIGSDIFEYGTGRGRNSIPLAEKGYHLTAIDIATRAIEDLSKTAKEKNLIIETIVGDARDIKHKKMYDAFVAIRLFHFLQTGDAINIIHEIQSHTKAGGYNAFVIFSHDSKKNEGFYFPTREEFLEQYNGWEIIFENVETVKMTEGKEMPRFSILLQRVD